LAIREWFKGKIVAYAAVIVISVLFMLFGVRYTLQDGYREIFDIIDENMGGMQSSFKRDAETVLRDSGAEVIRMKAEKIAGDIENYLIRHPHATVRDLQTDTAFKKIAIQPVARTGYTAVHEAGTSINRLHVNPKIVNTPLGALARELPEFWRIIAAAREAGHAGGYYAWRDADGSLREKYMWVAAVARPTADGVRLQVAATTYIDEFMQPLARLAQNLERNSTAASAKLRRTSDQTLNRTLIAMFMIILGFCGVGGYMASRLITGYRRLDREISRRDKAEQALREREQRQQRYAALFAELINRGAFFRGALDENLRSIVSLSARVLQTERVSIWMYSENYSEVRCRCLYKWSTDSFSEGEVLAASEFPSYISSHQVGRVIAARDVRNDPRTSDIPARYFDDHGIQSLLDAPVWMHGRLKALLSFEHIGEKRDWLPDEEQLALTLATYTSFCIEVEERERMEAALEKSKERYRDIFENAVEGIYQSTPDGRFLDVNPAMARMCGYESPTEMVTAVTDIAAQYYVDPLDRETFKGLLDEKGRIDNIEYRILDKDGNVIWLSGSARVVCNERGDKCYYEGRCQDITARKRAEEERKKLEAQLRQAQKMEAVGTLAGGIAHDFNNLLMGIQGYASLMLMALDESHPHYEKLRSIEKQVQSGADLTRQLLGFARGGRYEVKTTDLNELISGAAALFGRTKKETRIHEKYGEGLWTVEADRGQIEQVLLNLFVNAWQAMPGGGDLFLETQNIDIDLDSSKMAPYAIHPGSYVRISITDTGVGMDEKTQQRIFDPFFTTREMGKGAGLGLASAYGIIKSHGGFINVYSEKGHGTTFGIYLPAAKREAVRETLPVAAIRRGHETLLVVDDERMILDVTREILESLGYCVMVAQSGAEALEIYRRDHGKIDLAILDVIMPGMGGGELLDRMKAVNPDCRVILSSGYSLNGEAKAIMARGAKMFMQKPFRLDDLSQKIRGALEGRSGPP
jgi:PAS domain S-box-containing protein